MNPTSALQNLNVLIVSPESWEHIQLSKHHYAKALAERGNNVFFLGPPEKKYALTSTKTPRLKILHYPGFVRGLRFHPAFSRRKKTRKVYQELEAVAGEQFNVIWSFDNSVFYDFDALPESVLKISHIVDLNMDYQMASAARTADLCLCTTPFICKRLSVHNPKSHMLLHGVQQWPDEHRIRPFPMPGENQLKALYVGNLSMKYLDWEVLRNTAETHTHVDFVFIGPHHDLFDTAINRTHDEKRSIHALPNVYFPGRIASSEIPAALASADILLLAYQREHLRDQANPHKIMEYLQSGKPIAANFTAAFADHNLFMMCDEDHRWEEMFTALLTRLKIENEPAKVAARKAFARDHTYARQIERIEVLLRKHELL